MSANVPEAANVELLGSDEIVFADEIGIGGATITPWRLLIVDDEEEVHRVTRLALGGFTHAGAGLELLHAYSGREAMEIMARESDIAVVFMDVVMETEHAGLEAVQHIRQQLGNRMTRIVLRTGQPGQAPERDVITRYDINDYRDKTELTAQKLFTVLYTGLSLYQDLRLLEHSREGLQQLVGAASGVFQRQVLEHLADGVIELASQLMRPSRPWQPPPPADALLVEIKSGPVPARVLAATGDYTALAGQPISHNDFQRLKGILPPLVDRRWVSEDGSFYAEFPGSTGETFALLWRSAGRIQLPEPEVTDMFCRNVSAALQSAQLHRQVYETQRELIVMLSEAIEKRSRETGNHVRRVGEYSRLLGQLWGMDAVECDTLLIAAPLHDAGKIGIPDAILNKPGKLTEEEFVIMRTHAMMGGQMFAGQGLPVLQAAAVIAAQHHERWDGRGYPLGIAGTAIHPYGRIVALADVFDALGSDRCYKKAWPLDAILELLRAESGKQFDPMLVQLLLDHLDEFLVIRDRFIDVYSGEAAH